MQPDREHEAQMRYDRELGYQPIAGFKGTLVAKPISFSADGMREHDVALPPPTGPLVLAVGDSLTEGYLVGNDETWPAHLQRLLKRPVLNGGVRAYGLDQIVLRAERLVPQLKPATVVLAFIPDDVERTELDRRDGRPKPYFVPGQGVDGLDLMNVPVPAAPPPMALWRRVLGHSYLLDFLMPRLDLYDLWYGGSHHIQRGTGDEISCRLMRRFARLANGAGAEALVVALYEDHPWINARRQASDRRRAEAVLGCARQAGLATLDTWDGFATDGAARRVNELYYGSHFTDRGAALAAQLIAAALSSDKPPAGKGTR